LPRERVIFQGRTIGAGLVRPAEEIAGGEV
jgi:hypothetical protein